MPFSTPHDWKRGIPANVRHTDRLRPQSLSNVGHLNHPFRPLLPSTPQCNEPARGTSAPRRLFGGACSPWSGLNHSVPAGTATPTPMEHRCPDRRHVTCAWRIPKSVSICCADRDLARIDRCAIWPSSFCICSRQYSARLAGPGGARAMVAESVLVKHQLLILNRSRKRSPWLASTRPCGAGSGCTCSHRARRPPRLLFATSVVPGDCGGSVGDGRPARVGMPMRRSTACPSCLWSRRPDRGPT